MDDPTPPDLPEPPSERGFKAFAERARRAVAPAGALALSAAPPPARAAPSSA